MSNALEATLIGLSLVVVRGCDVWRRTFPPQPPPPNLLPFIARRTKTLSTNERSFSVLWAHRAHESTQQSMEMGVGGRAGGREGTGTCTVR